MCKAFVPVGGLLAGKRLLTLGAAEQYVRRPVVSLTHVLVVELCAVHFNRTYLHNQRKKYK